MNGSWNVPDPSYLGADFPPGEFDRRIAAVRTLMRERGLGALLVTRPENIYYLTGLNFQGYSSFSVLALPLIGPPMLVARAMEAHTIQYQIPDVKHFGFADDEGPVASTAAAIAETSGEVGVELRTMSLPVDLWTRISAAAPVRTYQDGSDLVEVVRAIKSPVEIAHLRRAAAVSDAAVRAGVEAVGTGRSERDVAAAVYHELIAAGSEPPGFAPFVRSTDILHHEHVTWQDRPIRAGAGVLFELSASVYRYHAPLTRMAYADEPPAGVRESAEMAISGLHAIVDALRPGAVGGDVYAAWKRMVDGPDRHHCGYMIGIGFPPSWFGASMPTGLRRDSDMAISAGMVFHIMSWIIHDARVPYCLSDTALVTSTGGELLTTTAREPFVRP